MKKTKNNKDILSAKEIARMVELYHQFVRGELWKKKDLEEIVDLMSREEDALEHIEFEEALAAARKTEECLSEEDLVFILPGGEVPEHLKECTYCRLRWLEGLVGVAVMERMEEPAEEEPVVEKEGSAWWVRWFLWPRPIVPVAAGIAIVIAILVYRGPKKAPQPGQNKGVESKEVFTHRTPDREFVNKLYSALPGAQGMGFTGEKDRRPKGFVLGFVVGLRWDLMKSGGWARRYLDKMGRKFRLDPELLREVDQMVARLKGNKDPCESLKKGKEDCDLGVRTYLFLRDRRGPFKELWKGLVRLEKRMGIVPPKLPPKRTPRPGKRPEDQIFGITVKILTF